MRISNSKIDLYDQCSMKYKFRYKDNLKGNYVASPLLFGIAMDAALNYILENFNENTWTVEAAEALFIEKMNDWDGTIRLDFFKSEVPIELLDILDHSNPEHQELVWENICKRGLANIDVYIEHILPLFEKVILVQNKGVLKNEEEDELVYVVDFIVTLKDGRTVLMDNKTSSAKYPKNKVLKSQQLSLYIEAFPEIKYAGYCVLLKDPVKVKCTHQVLVDEIPEETRQEAFDKAQKTAQSIKEEIFEPNMKACMLFGKPCEFSLLCKYNDPAGLVPAYPEKKKE